MTPEAALRRDLRLARQVTPLVRRQFDRERRRVLRNLDNPGKALRPGEWEDTLGEVWLTAGQAVFDSTYQDLTGEKVQRDARASQQLVALIARLIRDGEGAKTIAGFIDEASAGVVTTTRKRIQTVLRRVHRPSDAREISRALRRLYTTDFAKKRANRIALDSTLRATATYEHAAAMLAQVVTGREYLQVWRNQGDARVRQSHRNVAPVALNELFKLTSIDKKGFATTVQLRYPRDPAGPMSQTAGCRCWTERQRV